MRRGLVTKKVKCVRGSKSGVVPKRASNNGTLTIKAIPNQNQNQGEKGEETRKKAEELSSQHRTRRHKAETTWMGTMHEPKWFKKGVPRRDEGHL